MNKVKKLELEIEKLKSEISELRNQLLTLSLRPPISVPLYSVAESPVPTWPYSYPRIGDLPYIDRSTITCGT